MKKWIILAILAATGIFLFIKHSKEKVLVPGEVVSVRSGTVRNIVDATGIIKPQVGAEVKVGARISGIVTKENVKVGDIVKKGDLIAIIDNRELKVSLERARANLENLKTTYTEKIKAQKLSVKSAAASLREAEANLRSAKSNLDLKKWQFDREKELFGEGYSTEERLKKARFEYLSALESFNARSQELEKEKLNLKIARRKLKELENDYKTKLKIAEKDLEKQEIKLSYSFVYAPMDGIISYVSTQEGETVVAGLNAPEFVTILNPNRLENWIYVDETEIGKIKKGMKVEFSVDTYRDKIFYGTVEEIYPKPKLLNNVVYYNVVVRGFENGGKLRPEMTTHNKIIVDVENSTLVVPNNAVKWKKGKYVVYKVVDGRLKEVPVKTGWSDEKFTQVLSGLEEGDKIAISVRVK